MRSRKPIVTSKRDPRDWQFMAKLLERCAPDLYSLSSDSAASADRKYFGQCLDEVNKILAGRAQAIRVKAMYPLTFDCALWGDTWRVSVSPVAIKLTEMVSA